MLISYPQDKEILLHYGGSSIMTNILESGRGRLKERIRGRYNYERKALRNATRLALKMEEGAGSQRMRGSPTNILTLAQRDSQ